MEQNVVFKNRLVCQMVYFHTQAPNFGIFWNALEYVGKNGIVNGHLG
jgi:hypothetical protein